MNVSKHKVPNGLRRSRLHVAILVICQAGRLGAQSAPFQGLDAYVVKAMKEWEVPGIAISIVRNDSVILAKGYGVRELGKNSPVDERTTFAIGSSTKPFTTAALQILVDDGKLRWDDPVTAYLPAFQLYDPWVTRELTIRDLVTHRVGLTRGDLLWSSGRFDRDEILRRIRFLKPAWSFRSRWGYQNIMFIAAGQVVLAASGKKWDDFVPERIFLPLGMTGSSTSSVPRNGASNAATPHTEVDGVVRPIPYPNVDIVGPAGSITSNAVDMAQWLRLQLGLGRYGGKRIISETGVREMHAPQTVIQNPMDAVAIGARSAAYGLGWALHDYHGRPVVQHAGQFTGWNAMTVMLPEQNVGFAILTNRGDGSIKIGLMYRILDLALGLPERDWSAELLARAKQAAAASDSIEKRRTASRATGTSPAAPLSRYAGNYVDSLYGDVRIELEAGKLILHYGPNFAADLIHWHYETFRVQWRDRARGSTFVTFTLDRFLTPTELKIEQFADFRRAQSEPEQYR